MLKMKTCKVRKEREFLQDYLEINLDKYSGIDKRKVLRNCVLPKLGKHVFDSMNDSLPATQEGLFE